MNIFSDLLSKGKQAIGNMVEDSRQAKADAKLYLYWIGELEEALKREKDFRKSGKECVELYEAEASLKLAPTPFNIMYSNVETLNPSLYNSVPRPVVQRRFKDDDPLGMLSAKACTRGLEYLADTNSDAYSSLDEVLKQAVLEALVPGRGVSRVRYHAVIKTQGAESAASVPNQQELDETANAEQTESPEQQEQENALIQEDLAHETVCFDEVPWNHFRHGYGKRWSQVPWVAFTEYLSRAELKATFGDELGAKLPLTATSKEADVGRSQSEESHGSAEDGDVELAVVHEIWDKRTKRVLIIVEGWKAGPVKVQEDPLGLSGFFPCPRPLTFVLKISSQTPVSLYAFYKSQAEELNELTRRAKYLMKALKFRGGYDSTVRDIDKILEGEENTFIPVDGVASLGLQGSLDKAIWTVPVEMIVQTLREVLAQREAVKAVIYEITGMSDIIRGMSKASETLGAQQIKTQWGSLRIKRLQKEVMRYSRDMFRLAAEVAIGKLEESTWAAMTGMGVPTGSDKEKVQMQVQLAQQFGQQPPPEALQVLQQPSWSDILGLLRNSIQRNYRIDIETNSTVDAEATEDKEMVGEVLNAMAQFMSGAAPLVESGVMPFQVAQQMLLSVVRRYRFGPEIEDALKQMQPPKPPDDGKAKAEQEKHQLDMQAKQLDMQAKQQDQQTKAQADQLKGQLETRRMQMELVMVEKEHELAMQELAYKAQLEERRFQMEMQRMAMQAAMPAPESKGGDDATV